MSIPKQPVISPIEIEELDRFYREGGLRQMASPHVHYQKPKCPHPNCDREIEWIDFQLELFSAVRSWWEGTGFVGRCPQCQQWIHFTTLKMNALNDDDVADMVKLPDNWHTVAQFA